MTMWFAEPPTRFCLTEHACFFFRPAKVVDAAQLRRWPACGRVRRTFRSCVGGNRESPSRAGRRRIPNPCGNAGAARYFNDLKRGMTLRHLDEATQMRTQRGYSTYGESRGAVAVLLHAGPGSNMHAGSPTCTRLPTINGSSCTRMERCPAVQAMSSAFLVFDGSFPGARRFGGSGRRIRSESINSSQRRMWDTGPGDGSRFCTLKSWSGYLAWSKVMPEHLCQAVERRAVQ